MNTRNLSELIYILINLELSSIARVCKVFQRYLIRCTITNINNFLLEFREPTIRLEETRTEYCGMCGAKTCRVNIARAFKDKTHSTISFP